MSASDVLLFEVQDGIATLTLNRPEQGNSINPDMMTALEKAWVRVENEREIICAIMADVNRIPDWWRICVPLMDAADIRKMQIAAQRRLTKALGEVVDADKSLTAAIQRSEALAFHDEEHMRPHLDALRSMAGVPDRAMAQTKRKR